jgi:hypothetical protein
MSEKKFKACNSHCTRNYSWYDNLKTLIHTHKATSQFGHTYTVSCLVLFDTDATVAQKTLETGDARKY